MDCLNKEKNITFCSCSYSPCPRKGICCQCLRYHLSQQEVPACLFSPEAERTYNRSIEHFLKSKKS